MTTYRVNQAGVDNARKLISDERYDTKNEWSDAAPDTDEENRVIEDRGYEGYGAWHLGIDTEASEGTKDRYGFPFGDFSRLNRAALIHAKQRASQNDHDDIVDAADDLLSRLDEKTG